MNPAWQVRETAQEKFLEGLVQRFYSITDSWEDETEIREFEYNFLIALLKSLRDAKKPKDDSGDHFQRVPKMTAEWMALQVSRDEIKRFSRVPSEEQFLLAMFGEKLAQGILSEAREDYEGEGMLHPEDVYGVPRMQEISLDYYERKKNDGDV